MSRVVDSLPWEAFSQDNHKIIYQGLLTLYNEGKPTDVMQIVNWLAARSWLEKVGGKHKIAQLLDRSVSAVNIDATAALVLDKYQSRRLITAGNEIVEIGHDETNTIAERLNKAEQKIFEISDAQRRGGFSPASDIVNELWADIQQGTNPAIATNFYDLNDLLGGLFPGSLYVVCAVPGGGKSAFANRLAYDVAKFHGLASAIVSLEMPKKQVLNRFLADEASIPVSKLKSRQISEQEWPRYTDAIAVVSDVNLHIDDSGNISATEIVARVRRLKSQYGKLGCVVIDYLQLMIGDGNESTRNLELAGISRRFKLMAVELDVPVIVLSQLNRNLEQRSNKRPTLSDIRDTGALGQDADVVLGLYRDEIHNSDTPDKGIVEICAIKHRDGELGTVKLLFDGAFMRFRNLAR